MIISIPKLYIKTRKLCSVIWLSKICEGVELMRLQCHPPDCGTSFFFLFCFVFVKIRKQTNRKLEYCLCFYTLRSIKNKTSVSGSTESHCFLYPKTQVKSLSIYDAQWYFHGIQSWNWHLTNLRFSFH